MIQEYIKHTKLPFLLISLINIIFFIGCAAQKPSIVEPTLDINQKLANEIRGSILSNENKLHSLKANAVIKVKSPDFRVPIKLKGILRYKRPDALRLVASKFTFTIFDMTYKSDHLSFYVPQERKVFLGSFDKSTWIEVTGLTFKPYDVFNIFNFNELFRDMEYNIEPYKELWKMHIYDNNHSPRHLLADLYINKNNDVTRYDLFDRNGKPNTLVTLDEFKELNGYNFPQKIKIKWPQNKTSLSLTFLNPKVNQELSDKMFNFSMPENAEIVTISNLY